MLRQMDNIYKDKSSLSVCVLFYGSIQIHELLLVKLEINCLLVLPSNVKIMKISSCMPSFISLLNLHK